MDRGHGRAEPAHLDSLSRLRHPAHSGAAVDVGQEGPRGDGAEVSGYGIAAAYASDYLRRGSASKDILLEVEL